MELEKGKQKLIHLKKMFFHNITLQLLSYQTINVLTIYKLSFYMMHHKCQLSKAKKFHIHFFPSKNESSTVFLMHIA